MAVASYRDRRWSALLPSGVRALGLLAVTCFAFLVGFWNQSHVHVALVLAALPLCLALIVRPAVPLVAGVAFLPFSALAVIVGGLEVAAADVLLLLAMIGTVIALLLQPAWRTVGRDARVGLWLGAPFAAWMLAVLIHDYSRTVALNSLQALFIILVPFLLGAVAAGRREARLALALFVVAAGALSAIWVITRGNNPLAQDKNPAGQFIADAVILVLALAPTWWWRLLLLPLLGAGLAFTESRGALLGAGVGLVVLLALRGLGSWPRTLAALVPLAILVAVGFAALPQDVIGRSTDFSSGSAATQLNDLSGAEYSVRLRYTFRQEGWQLVDAHPVFGVGPGNYHTGLATAGTYTVDPHDVVIRTAGDFGYPGLVFFGLLVVGTGVDALRRRKVNPYAAVAIAVQAAVLTHGFVDVYWVRGTPVLAWLLLGMAVNRRLDRADA